MANKKEICFLCGKARLEADTLLKGKFGYICSDCVAEAYELLNDKKELIGKTVAGEPPRLALVTMRTPQDGPDAVVDELLRRLKGTLDVPGIAACKKNHTCHKLQMLDEFAHREGEMGEDDGRVAVLRQLRRSALDLGDERLDVARIDERCELGTERQLLAPKVTDLGNGGVEHETFAQEPCGVEQESPLLLARELGGLLGPGDEFEVLVVVTQTHQRTEKPEILVTQSVVLPGGQVLQLQQTAPGEPGHTARLDGVGDAAVEGGALQNRGRDTWHSDLLRTREDGGQQTVGPLGNKDEERALPRLFENLENLVGGLLVHSLGQPHEHDLIIGLETLERELADDFVGLAGGNHPLERLAEVKPVVPILRRNVPAALGEQLAETGQKLVAQHDLAGLLALLVDGKNQMEVGVGQSGDLPAIGTLAARIAVVAMAAAKILHVSDGQRQRPGPGGPRKQLGMADPPGIDRTRQMPLELLLPYDVGETHLSVLLFSERGPHQRPDVDMLAPDEVGRIARKQHYIERITRKHIADAGRERFGDEEDAQSDDDELADTPPLVRSGKETPIEPPTDGDHDRLAGEPGPGGPEITPQGDEPKTEQEHGGQTGPGDNDGERSTLLALVPERKVEPHPRENVGAEHDGQDMDALAEIAPDNQGEKIAEQGDAQEDKHRRHDVVLERRGVHPHEIGLPEIRKEERLGGEAVHLVKEHHDDGDFGDGAVDPQLGHRPGGNQIFD